jgi:S-adenosylmethionine:tRNA ribosyltransferase-isomerase
MRKTISTNCFDLLKMINLSDYNYSLPDERIAKFPLPKRDESKLLVYRQGEVSHRVFKEIHTLLPADTLLVFNNTKVIPARLFFQKPTGAIIQLFLLHPVLPTPIVSEAMLIQDSCVWECMIGNRKRWKNESLEARVPLQNQEIVLRASIENAEKSYVRFDWSSSTNEPVNFVEIVQAFGQIPLPPYLNRETTEADSETYQTVYSKEKGAVAAPTAGLHFTDDVLNNLLQKGINQEFITLHVGAGTFQPIKVQNIMEHTMHNEQLVFSRSNIENLLKNVDKIIPVGTTSMRALESLYWYGAKLWRGGDERFFVEKLEPYQQQANPSPAEALEAILEKMQKNNWEQLIGETEIFIFPGYEFKFCRGLITNFHQPESTLLLLISALIGPDWQRVYDIAFQENYRFLSYGDSSLLLP